MKHDWRGNEIVEPEAPETIINFWVISPGNNGFDEIWIRDYHDAVEFAQERIAARADDCGEPDLLEFGVTITMKLRRGTLEEYMEIQEREP